MGVNRFHYIHLSVTNPKFLRAGNPEVGPRVGTRIYYFGYLSRKLHEIEKIVPKGGVCF